MAHLIDMTNGRANMAYVGETPWHGLGQSLAGEADLDQWRVAAGLNWEANRNALYYRDAEKVVRKSEREVLYRSDTGAELGIVSPSYQIVQPRDVMEFFRDLTADNGFTMETAGCLDGGRKAWALARTGHNLVLPGRDEVNGFLLLATSFDGTLATTAKFTTTRVVCDNTIQIALAGKSGIRVSHSSVFNETQVKIDLGILNSAFSEFGDNAHRIARQSIGRKAALQFLLDVLAKPDSKIEDLSTVKANIIQNVFQLWEGRGIGANMESANGTVWGLVNAVTQYVDHTYGRNVNNRFKNAQLGLGADLKMAAFKSAVAMAA